MTTGIVTPGERLIEAARLAYRHVIGADFADLDQLVEGARP